MTVRLFTAGVLVLTLFVSSQAQEADSTDVPAVSDTIPHPVGDSTVLSEQGDSLPDSSVTGSSFEERYEKYRREVLERPAGLSYFDSLVTYFTSPRMDVSSQRDRSFYHDAGDYFRFDPSYFALEGQVTPMRKTVRPFGLTGDRMNLVGAGMNVHPFNHVLEPDGLVDCNDLPTALDDRLYLMAGPAGRLFGGRQVVATLVTLPETQNGTEPSTAIMGDKGEFGYSWVRGRYSRRFHSGKALAMSIGYREADGPVIGRSGDDGYHYVGDLFFPLGVSYGFRARGQLYNRDGQQTLHPDFRGMTVSKDRFDRYAELALERRGGEGRVRYQVGYRHRRQGSFSDGGYTSRFNLTGNGAFISREWIRGRTMVRARIDGEYREYEYYDNLFSRSRVDATLELARLSEGMRWTFVVGGRYDDEFSFLPDGAAVVSNETEWWFWQVSIGYCERAPQMHELFLPFQRASMAYTDSSGYADEGNRELEPERQLTGNLLLEYGSIDNAVRVTVTGGRIENGIDWHHQWIEDIPRDYLLFSPQNGDIDFINVTVLQRIRLKDFLRLSGGGSYRWSEYEQFEDKAYQPEYQAFGGLELHHYWEPKALDLFAYGELVYVGPYRGYFQDGLGQEVVANAKLTLGLKDFRFHFVFQNVLNRFYQQLDYQTSYGMFFYYGLVWKFSD